MKLLNNNLKNTHSPCFLQLFLQALLLGVVFPWYIFGLYTLIA